MNRTVKAALMHLCIVAGLLALSVLVLTQVASGAEPNFRQLEKVRPDYTTGFGYIIDDLEQHTLPGHPMRNERDPGNWVHELTHQLNSDLREMTRANDNCFYLFMGEYVRLNEPRVTLKQVAALVPRGKQGAEYQAYLVSQQRYWNSEPLYVLDEMTAMTNALHYHFITGTKDEKRLSLVVEFIDYSDALLRAVEKYDPRYNQLGELRTFIKWSQRRSQAVIDSYNGNPPVPDINPDDPKPYVSPDKPFIPLYKLSGRYHNRNRTKNFFKRNLTVWRA